MLVWRNERYGKHTTFLCRMLILKFMFFLSFQSRWSSCAIPAGLRSVQHGLYSSMPRRNMVCESIQLHWKSSRNSPSNIIKRSENEIIMITTLIGIDVITRSIMQALATTEVYPICSLLTNHPSSNFPSMHLSIKQNNEMSNVTHLSCVSHSNHIERLHQPVLLGV